MYAKTIKFHNISHLSEDDLLPDNSPNRNRIVWNVYVYDVRLCILVDKSRELRWQSVRSESVSDLFFVDVKRYSCKLFTVEGKRVTYKRLWPRRSGPEATLNPLTASNRYFRILSKRIFLKTFLFFFVNYYANTFIKYHFIGLNRLYNTIRLHRRGSRVSCRLISCNRIVFVIISMFLSMSAIYRKIWLKITTTSIHKIGENIDISGTELFNVIKIFYKNYKKKIHFQALRQTINML